MIVDIDWFKECFDTFKPSGRQCGWFQFKKLFSEELQLGICFQIAETFPEPLKARLKNKHEIKWKDQKFHVYHNK